MKRLLAICLLSAAALSAGCESSFDTSLNDEYSPRSLPIINGSKVSGTDYSNVVMLYINYSGSKSAYCTGTLISPKYVLTAGHCVSDCKGSSDSIEAYHNLIGVGIGNSEKSLTNTYKVKRFIPHPNFYCVESYNGSEIRDDIALIELASSVPMTVASPAMVMPPSQEMTSAEVKNGVKIRPIGFGKTIANNDNSSGTKYQTQVDVYAACSKTSVRSSGECSWLQSRGYNTDGIIYSNESQTGTCQGDSGGPSFWSRNGIDYVVGVTSWGEEGCSGVSAYTMVSDYYDFISANVPDLAAASPEDCYNDRDDNGDGRVDCADPYCFGVRKCQPENCSNNVDDNDNGKVDCEDLSCANDPACLPEDCSNKKDDNGDGLVDCEDPKCVGELVCQPEDCTNGKDDNGNGLKDCADPQCAGFISCREEICDNGEDDNGNGLIDCDEPSCKSALVCQPEICNDGKDNNGDGRIDCADPQCRNEVFCQPEICNDGKDNNGDGRVDCADPQCSSHSTCVEICNDMVDNNGDGLVDCKDPKCAADVYCSLSNAANSSCSADVRTGSSPMTMILACLGLFGFAAVRRRRA